MPEANHNELPNDLPDWERELMDLASWDQESVEHVPGTPVAQVGFPVFFGHEQLRLLSPLAQRERIRPGDLIQRYVAERLDAERTPSLPPYRASGAPDRSRYTCGRGVAIRAAPVSRGEMIVR